MLYENYNNAKSYPGDMLQYVQTFLRGSACIFSIEVSLNVGVASSSVKYGRFYVPDHTMSNPE